MPFRALRHQKITQGAGIFDWSELSPSLSITFKLHRLLSLALESRDMASRAIEDWMKTLLTVAETADALNLKISIVRAWIAKRKLPRVNCGRAVRIPAKAVVEFIERNTIPAREPRQ